jgi:hypothetical protein
VLCRGGSNNVSGPRVAVDGVHPSCLADDLGKGDSYITPAGTYVGALPAGTDPEALERDGERPPVYVVSEAAKDRLALRGVLPGHGLNLQVGEGGSAQL